MKPATRPHRPCPAGDTAGRKSPADSGLPAAFRRLAALADQYALEPAQSPKELEAIAWMRQTLEDLEVTIICLGQSNLPTLLDDQQRRPHSKPI